MSLRRPRVPLVPYYDVVDVDHGTCFRSPYFSTPGSPAVGTKAEHKTTLRRQRRDGTSLLGPLLERGKVQHQEAGHVQLRRVRPPGLLVFC